MKLKHQLMYMRIAEAAAETSSAVRLKVGCCLVKNNAVIAVSYNGLPSFLEGPLEDKVYSNGAGGWMDVEEFKEIYPYQDDDGHYYKLVTRRECRHAEKNSLLALAKSNESAIGASMFVTHSCCELCAIDIIDSGIQTVYYRNEYRDTKGLDYLKENSIEVIKI